jgi:hypothetical protein
MSRAATWLVLAAVAAGAFGATRWLRHHGDDVAPAAARPDPAAAALPTAGGQAPAERTARRPPLRRPLRGVSLTPTQRAAETDWPGLVTLRNAVLERTLDDLADRGVRLEDCLPPGGLPLPVRVRFAIPVRSSGESATTGAWRFVEIVDGVPLAAGAVACLERILGGPYELRRPDHVPLLDDFDGELTFDYPFAAAEP